MLERIFAFSTWTKLVPEVTKTTVTGCLEPSLGRIVNPGASVIYPGARGGISIGATTLRIRECLSPVRPKAVIRNRAGRSEDVN